MTIKTKIMNVVALAVHWFFWIIPVAALYAIHEYVGQIPAAVVFVGGTLRFLAIILFPGGREERSRPILKKHDNVFTKKSVLVIGSGPAGVATTKECFEAGHDVICFDASERLGGTFANYFWPGGKLTSSPYVTAFSDYEPPRKVCGEEKWDHHSAEEYVEYLHDYSKHYGVSDKFRMKHKVLHVEENDNGQIMAQVQDLVSGKTTTEGPFDHVAVCSGAFHNKLTPKFAGIETFPGKLLHTRDFAASTTQRTQDEAFKDCAGKRIVSIGLGESMADILGIITMQISNPTTYAACAVRKGALIVPRIHFGTGGVTDLRTTRLRHALPKYIRNIAVNMNFATESRATKKAIARFDLIQKLPNVGVTFVKSTKSGMFLPAIEADKLVIKPAFDRIEGSTVFYKDGTKSEDVEVIIYGTGYDLPRFPFIDDNSFRTKTGEKMMNPDSAPIDRLFRMFNPEIGDKVAYLGLGIRPLVGSIPTSAEMQARVFATVVSGKRQLPSKAIMNKKIQMMKKHQKAEAGFYIEQWFLYVNWIQFMDMCAREIGCIPKASWLITNPNLWFTLLLSPMNTFQYRLRGNGSKPKLAKDVLSRLPWVELKENFFFASIHYTMSLYQWPVDAGYAVKNFFSDTFSSEDTKMD